MPQILFINSDYFIFTDFKEVLSKKIDYHLLKEIVVLHSENPVIMRCLNEMLSNFEDFKSGVIQNFSKNLFDVSSVIEYKEPDIIEEIITEEDIYEVLKRIDVKDPESTLERCKEAIHINKDILSNYYLLSNEEALLIASYTYEGKANEASPYKIINKKLRERDIQDQLTNQKSYIRLLLRALRKLPRTKPQTLYRGIMRDKHEYKVGEEIEWKGFTSTSTNMRATQIFLRNRETRKVEGTLFEIRNAWGYDIHDFSGYIEEGTHKNTYLT